jgi:hypothetical protein
MSKAIEMIPDQILQLGESELKGRVEPNQFHELLRIAFWNEYNVAQQCGRKMNLSNVYAGVCHQMIWQKTISNSFTLAYIISPPPASYLKLEYLMNKGLEQIEDILSLPHVKKDGSPDARMADVKYRITQDLINRVKGQVIQRVEVKSQNLNVNAEVKTQSPVIPTDMDSVDRKLAELESRASGINFGEIDVGRGAQASIEEEIIIEDDGEGT